MNDLSGKVVRGYELRELIGIGGYGGVYRAYQPLVDREVAIKIILPEYANRPYFIRNFEFEAQIVARLEHLHIVPLYDYWRDPDGAYIVMRLLRGGSLSQLLRNGPLDIDVAVRMVEQIASALTIAHRHGVVHQDMKSANILLDEDQNTFLSDFGIAKDLTQSSEQDVDDPDNVVRGSPEYVSPEQILNAPIDLKTDIYSLGIVFFEMLTGTTPFKSDDDQEVLRCQLYEKVPPLQNFDPDLPDILNIVIQRATDKHPKRRYPNALSMAEGLRQFVTLHAQSSDVIAVVGATESATAKDIDQSVDVLSIDANLFTEPTNPYKGLRAFQEADTADFYGRNQLIARLQDRLQEDEEEARFLAVVGPSGSGKSSVIKAGLIPSLRKGDLPGSQNWYIQEMTPGANPIEELKETLLKVATVSDSTLLDLLYADQNGLLHALNRILPDDGSELFLLIDQFEEIFTVVPEEAQRVHFLSLLQNAVLAENTRLRLVATLRADFYDRPLLYAGFGNLMRQRTEVVLPLSSEELREAIVMPAERVGLQLEEGLADEILVDVNEQPSALPLLQYALTELYMNRRGNTLTKSVYRNTGGVSGALTRRADEIYLKMSTERKEVARQVFLRLVTLGEGTEDTRRRALQAELLSVNADSQEIQHVIDTYGKYRLLAFDREPMSRAPTVEIAHEALIREWRHLREWLDSNRDDLRIQRQLAAAASEWLKFNRDASFLASGIRLSQFEILMNKGALALNANEKGYVQESARLRERNLRLRRAVIVALALISIVAIAFAIVAYRNQQETEKARDGLVVAQATTVAERDRADEQSRISRSRELSITALTNRDHFDLALLLNLEALDAEQTFNARSTLLTLLQSNARLVTFLHGHKDWVRTVTFSADGSLLATASRDNTIILWDVETRQVMGAPLMDHGDWVNTLAFSPDGAILASGGRDNRVILWDVATGKPIGDPLIRHTDDVWSVAFSPDGETLASGSADNTIILWDVQSQEIIGSPLTEHTDDVYAVAFSPDGETLASGSADNTIRLWNLASQEQNSVALEGHTNWARSVAFSSDGALLASGSNDQTVRLWDVKAQQQIGSAFVGHTGTVREVILDFADHRIISASEDGLVLFWDLDSGSLVDGFENLRRTAVLSIALDPVASRNYMAVGGQQNDVMLWEANAQSRLERGRATSSQSIALVSFSQDSARVFSIARSLNDTVPDEVDIVDLDQSPATLQSIELEKPLRRQTLASAINLASGIIATGGNDQTIILYNLASGQVIGEPLTGHADALFSIAMSPDGSMMLSGGNGGAIVLWRRDENGTWGAVSDAIPAHESRVMSLEFSPDGMMAASGDSNGEIRLWEVQGDTLTPNGEPLIGHTNTVLSLQFSPDGTKLASGGRDSLIILWDLEKRIGQTLTGHLNMVNSLSFNPAGTMLASGSRDNTVILWDLSSADGTVRIMGSPFVGHQGFVNSVAFSQDGEWLASGDENGLIITWDVGLKSWRNAACQIANRDMTNDEWVQYLGVFEYHATCSLTQ